MVVISLETSMTNNGLSRDKKYNLIKSLMKDVRRADTNKSTLLVNFIFHNIINLVFYEKKKVLDHE